MVDESKPGRGDWQVFEVAELMQKVAGNEPRFHEFLRVPSLSISVYRLPAGCKDMQAPHLEDEVYFVLEGKARLQVDGNEKEVKSGSVLYVKAETEHSFFDIEEDLTVLALFGAQGR